MALHIRQAEVTARKPIGELFMIQPQQVQHGRMQIMDVHSIFDCIPSPFVSRARRSDRLGHHRQPTTL